MNLAISTDKRAGIRQVRSSLLSEAKRAGAGLVPAVQRRAAAIALNTIRNERGQRRVQARQQVERTLRNQRILEGGLAARFVDTTKAAQSAVRDLRIRLEQSKNARQRAVSIRVVRDQLMKVAARKRIPAAQRRGLVANILNNERESRNSLRKLSRQLRGA